MSTSPTTLLAIEPLNAFDKLSFAWLLPFLVIRCTTNFASLCLSRSEVSKLHWRQKLALAYLQAVRTTLTDKQQAAQSRKPLTGPQIQEYCRKQNLNHRSVSLNTTTLNNERDIPTAVLHFIPTPTEAQSNGPTIFYFHGGGYHNPMRAEGHIPFVTRCAAACKAKEIVFLEYSLSPEHQYPCQLIQAVAGLRFLLEEEGIPVENIILGGDSAGGHLIASLLTHIVHPSPYAPAINLCRGQFKGVFFVSPWLKMSQGREQTGVPKREHNDYLTWERIGEFQSMFNPVRNEAWSHPYEAKDARAVWKKLFPGGSDGAICRRAILAAGTSEILFDSCVSFGRDFVGFQSVCVDTKESLELVKETDFVLAIAPGEAHVQPGLDSAVKYYDGWMMKGILTFLETC